MHARTRAHAHTRLADIWPSKCVWHVSRISATICRVSWHNVSQMTCAIGDGSQKTDFVMLRSHGIGETADGKPDVISVDERQMVKHWRDWQRKPWTATADGNSKVKYLNFYRHGINSQMRRSQFVIQCLEKTRFYSHICNKHISISTFQVSPGKRQKLKQQQVTL